MIPMDSRLSECPPQAVHALSDMVEQRGDVDLFTVSVCITVIIIGVHFGLAALAAIRAADGSTEQVQFTVFSKIG